jgi:hypothetical protein
MKNVKGPRAGFNPKTAAKTEMKPKPPVRATGSNAFPDAQKQVKQPPQPFANPKGPVNLKAPGNFAPGEQDVMVKPGNLGSSFAATPYKSIGAKGLPDAAAVGQKKPINHSGNVFGRFGTSHPKKSSNPVVGQKSKRGSAFYGDN